MMILWCYDVIFLCVLSFCFGKCLYSCSSSSSSSVVFYICCILCEIYTVYCVRRCSLALVSVDVNHITNDSGLSWRYYSRVSRPHGGGGVAAAWPAVSQSLAARTPRSLPRRPWQPITHRRHPLSNYYQTTFPLSLLHSDWLRYTLRIHMYLSTSLTFLSLASEWISGRTLVPTQLIIII